MEEKDGDLQGDEEEEDPFGLGRIMAADVKPAGSTGGSSGGGEPSSETADRGGVSKRTNAGPLQNSAGHGASGPRKAQKTAPGGYFSGVFHHASERTEGQGERDGASAAADGANKLPFIRSNCFKGARLGYVFQKGSVGLGYYADKVFAARVKAAGMEERRRRADDGDADGGPMGRPGNAAPAPAAAKEKAEGSKKPPVDVRAAAHKLEALLLKPKKAAKAASLMADLMDAEMRPENATLFFRYGTVGDDSVSVEHYFFEG